MARDDICRDRDEGSEWLTPVELSEEIKIPLQTLYGWRRGGTGPPAHRIGRHLRYRRSDVETWLADQTQGRAS